jgi:cell division transport system permease protein
MRANVILSGVGSGIRRNVTMTIALVLSTAIALAFVGASYLASVEITNFKHDYEGRLNVSVYLCTKESAPPCKGYTTTKAQTQALSKSLHADPLVRSVKYISPAEQYRRFIHTVPPKERKATTPHDLFASFTVKLKDLQHDFDKFDKKYSSRSGVFGVSNEEDVLKTLLKIIDGVRLLSIVVAIVVLVASVLLIANTIQLAAAQRRAETSIMRLVGASRWMTELPFILETVVATVIGGLIAIGFLALGKQFVLNGIFKSPVEKHVIPNLGSNDILVAGGIGLIAGIVLAGLTAFATLRLYVRL